ncbi:MAG: c-type cytochrome [bacterium]
MCKIVSAFVMALWMITFSCQQKNSSEHDSSPAADSLVTRTMNPPPQSEMTSALQLNYAEQNGKLLYEKYCSICHGLQGQGDGFNAYNLDPRPKDLTASGYLDSVSDAWLMEAIGQGGRGVKRSVLMPAYENTLTKHQIENVVGYLRYLSRRGSNIPQK